MNISRYRNFLGFTQQEMANFLEISKQSYWNKENGRTAFSDKEKVKVKNLLIDYFPEITIDDIFFDEKVLKSIVKSDD